MKLGTLGLRLLASRLVLIVFALSSDGARSVAKNQLAESLNVGWRFQLGAPENDPSRLNFDDSGWSVVSLPHSLAIYNANLDGFKESGRTVGWYRRKLVVPAEWAGTRTMCRSAC